MSVRSLHVVGECEICDVLEYDTTADGRLVTTGVGELVAELAGQNAVDDIVDGADVAGL